jgi:hypothetical protein
MSQRTALIIAAALTTFVLVAIGAAIGWAAGHQDQLFSHAQAAPAQVAEAAPAEAQASMAGDAGVQVALAEQAAYQPVTIQDLLDREAALQDLVQQANERLQKASADNLSMTNMKVSSDQAAAIALSLAPQAHLMEAPRLVNFQGTPAYQIALDAGMFYIDANLGTVLFSNLSLPPVLQPMPAPGLKASGGGEKASNISLRGNPDVSHNGHESERGDSHEGGHDE